MPTSSTTYRIRAATNADVPRIKEVVFAALEEYGLHPDPGGTDRDLDDVEVNYLARGGLFEVVVDDDGQVVGSAGLYPLSDGRVELRKMYLAPSARRRGLGKQLLERMIGGACRLGYQEIVLQTNAVLKEAVALYRRYEFTPTELQRLSPRCDQAYGLRLSDRQPR